VTQTDNLLRALISVTARQAFPPDVLHKLVMSHRAGPKQLTAFNLCDGTRTQGQICAESKLDQGNFSKTVTRWIAAGIVFRLGSGRDARLLHVYPVTETSEDVS
jgi:hypothetical protein